MFNFPARIIGLVTGLICSNIIYSRSACRCSIPAVKFSALLCPVIRQRCAFTKGIRSQVRTAVSVTNQRDFVCERDPACIECICCYFHATVCLCSSCLCSIPAVKGISCPFIRCWQSAVCTVSRRELQCGIIIVNQRINSNGSPACISCRIFSSYGIYSALCHSK